MLNTDIGYQEITFQTESSIIYFAVGQRRRYMSHYIIHNVVNSCFIYTYKS